MDVISQARKLGAALQADPAYVRYAKAIVDNDKNEDLQAAIGEFNVTRMNLDNELSKEEADKDEVAVKMINEKLRGLYENIMKNPAMVEFNEAKADVDKLLADINSIIMMCAQGQDPETCEISDCTGNCSSCGGCH